MSSSTLGCVHPVRVLSACFNASWHALGTTGVLDGGPRLAAIVPQRAVFEAKASCAAIGVRWKISSSHFRYCRAKPPPAIQGVTVGLEREPPQTQANKVRSSHVHDR